jgi:phenylacetate-CoA ligase
MDTLDERLASAVKHAYDHASAFKQIMDQANLTPADIRGVGDLHRIPVTSKDVLVQMQQQHPPFGGWLAVPLESLQRIYVSPGPLYDPYDGHDNEIIMSAVQAFQAGGLASGDRVLNTFLYHMVPAGLLIDEALRALKTVVVPTGPGNTETQIKVLTDLNVNAYVGTPSFLAMIYDKAAEMGLSADRLPLRKAYFTAEPYPPSLRKKFEQGYELQTAQAYATADLGFVAYERAGIEGMLIPDNLMVEVADADTGAVQPDGEVGEVVVTTFSSTYPLIRFGTGDLGVMASDPTRLMGLVGRSGEAIKVRGMFLHPNQLKLVAQAFPQIKHTAAIVTRQANRDVLTLQVELADDHALPDRDEFAAIIVQAMREKGRLRVDTVEFVQAGEIDPEQRMIRTNARSLKNPMQL